MTLSARQAADPAPDEARIPLCVPEISGLEWLRLKACLDSGWISTAGPEVDSFETAFAEWLGARFALATINGTAALHLALIAAGVEPDDEVLMPSFTFIATANAVRYAGAWPVFLDSALSTWQMDVGLLARFLEDDCRSEGGALRNRRTGRRIAALLPVHVLGHPVDMDPVQRLAERFGLPIVEDATESLGARYRGRPVGRDGTVACFSFNGNKMMTTGGGGMLVTDDPKLAERARYLATTAKDDPAEGVHGAVGFNYRLTALQAALGSAQLARLDDFVAAKRRIAARYREGLAALPGVSFMPEPDWAECVFWLASIRVDPEAAPLDRKALGLRLDHAGIATRPFWQPLHLSPAHKDAQSLGGAVAERLHREVLSLPCSCGLTAEQQDRVIAALRAAFR